MTKIRIGIVEDQIMLQDSLTGLINLQPDMEVVGVADVAADALALCQNQSLDLLLMDVMTGSDVTGIAAAAQIRVVLPAVKIIIMTALPEITFLTAARKAGVQSFVYKSIKSDDLLFTIRNTFTGYTIYPTDSRRPVTYDFTLREIAVLRLVCQAKSRREIAEELHTSESTIKLIITSILNKTGFDSIMRFAIYAVANGFIVPNKID